MLTTCQGLWYTPSATCASTHLSRHILTNTVYTCINLLLPLWSGSTRAEGGMEREGWQVGLFKEDEVLLLLHKTVFAWIVFTMHVFCFIIRGKSKIVSSWEKNRKIWYFVNSQKNYSFIFEKIIVLCVLLSQIQCLFHLCIPYSFFMWTVLVNGGFTEWQVTLIRKSWER